MDDLTIDEDEPGAPEVRAVLERHLAFAEAHTAPEDVHALPAGSLDHPDVAFFTARLAGRVVAVGALRRLDDRHAEVKSMHTLEEVRGRGVGQRLLDHLVEAARTAGYGRLSLETGSNEAFAPARALYARAGFVESDAFGDFIASPVRVFMSLDLEN